MLEQRVDLVGLCLVARPFKLVAEPRDGLAPRGKRRNGCVKIENVRRVTRRYCRYSESTSARCRNCFRPSAGPRRADMAAARTYHVPMSSLRRAARRFSFVRHTSSSSCCAWQVAERSTWSYVACAVLPERFNGRPDQATPGGLCHPSCLPQGRPARPS